MENERTMKTMNAALNELDLLLMKKEAPPDRVTDKREPEIRDAEETRILEASGAALGELTPGPETVGPCEGGALA
jgi:hypothetical protein